ncbi:MAG: hypothetical protein LIO99_08685 [Clostridiales bacterium]|nr:hypothetical protein [Clostridiales bacterium]
MALEQETVNVQQEAEEQKITDGQKNGKDVNEDETAAAAEETPPMEFRVVETGREEHDTQIMMAEISNYAAYLQSGDEFRYHKSLLYMMCRENLDKEFIKKIFANGGENDIVSLDLLHCAAVVAGEDFALEFLGKEMTIESFREAIADHSALRKFQAFESIQEISDETARARDAYNIHIEYLKQSRDDLKKYYDGMLSEREKHYQEKLQLKEEMHGKDILALTEKRQTESGILNDNLENLKSELAAVQKSRDELQTALEKEKEAAAAAVRDREKTACEYEQYKKDISTANNIDNDAENRKRKRRGKRTKGFIRGRFFHGKEEERNKDFVLTLISNPQFTAEQLSVINDALNQKLPPENLAKICNPKIPVRNMKMMLAYMQRSEMGSVSAQQKKEGTHHEATNENS